MCLPVVVCNLGSEMIYILEQRLRAQSITSEKSVKVLHDVVKSMFDPTFVSELFKPQEVYSQRATRQIFDKLAHSSIMRLSESSMDKLYDLMTMGMEGPDRPFIHSRTRSKQLTSQSLDTSCFLPPTTTKQTCLTV